MNQNSQVGHDLATKVARKLSQGYALRYSHPYYCGTGLFYIEGAFVHCECGDWILPSKARALELEAKGQEGCRVFQTENAFIAWLERQTDELFLGHNGDDNQRITLLRLLEFVSE